MSVAALSGKGGRWFATLAALAASAALVFSFLDGAQVSQVWAGVRSVGPVFPLILALGGLRFAIRAAAWMACVERGFRLRFSSAFAAFVAADAAGNLTPAGLLVSEPAKAMLVGTRLPSRVAAASIAVENLVYAFSVAIMIVAGGVFFLAAIPGAPISDSLRTAGTAVLSVAIAGTLGVMLLAFTRRRPAAALYARLAATRGADGRLGRWLAAISGVESRVLGFARTDIRHWSGILALDAAYHGVAIAEVWLTLRWIMPAGEQPTLAQAFVLETVNRLITVVFKFVPLRIGVDEAGTAAAGAAIGVGSIAGVTLALVRKARIACWMVAGLGILLRRSWVRGRKTATSGPAPRVPPQP